MMSIWVAPCALGVRLLRVQLDDELLADRVVDLLALGIDAHGDAEAVVTDLEPARDRAVEDVEVAA